MLANFRSAVSKLRVRQREAIRRHAQRRTLRAEPLEGRLLMTGDSWVVPTGILDDTGNYTPVAADDAGNVYVGATRYDGSATDPDICLSKYLPNGQEDVNWKIDLPLPGRQVITDLVVVSNDGVYIVGFFDGKVNLDPNGGAAGELQSRGEDDAYLAKYSINDGAFLWAHQWGGAGTDWLRDIAVSGDSVYVTGNTEISVRNKVETHHLVASVSSNNLTRWEKTTGPIWGYTTAIAAFTPTGAPTNVYVTEKRETGGYVMKLTETVDGNDVVPGWTYDLGATISMAGWGGIAVGDGDPLPSLYVLTQGSGSELLKIRDEGDSATKKWSAPIGTTAYPWGVAFDSTTDTVYVAGTFGAQADFGGVLLTSRGSDDGFLARYNKDGGLLAAQRMGGDSTDRWRNLAVNKEHVYLGGSSRSTNGDFPVGQPGEMSAFAPGDPLREVFVMKLDAAAPIVQAVYTDISAAPAALFTLSARTASGNKIVWYEHGELLPGQLDHNPDFTLSRPAGVYQFTAVATNDATGKIGMAGVEVNVAVPTKFYVVDDDTANQTFEYDANGNSVESYSLNTGTTAPRGAASTVTGDKTWVVDANRRVYVYNNSGALLGSWTAGTLSTKAKVEGITVYGSDVWIVDDYSNKVYKYAGAASQLSGTWTATSVNLNTANTSPKDIVTDGTYLWVVNDSTTDKVFKYNLAGTLQGSWTIGGGGGSPTGITLDPSNASQDLWIVDSGSKKVYEYTNGRNATSGTTQTATKTFALAAGNTNPQGIADPPAPSSLVTTEAAVFTEPVSTEAALVDNLAAFEARYYYEPPRDIRVDHTPRIAPRGTVMNACVPDYTIGAAPDYLTGDMRYADDNDGQAEVDDLFAEWESDPLELVSLPDLGI